MDKKVVYKKLDCTVSRVKEGYPPEKKIFRFVGSMETPDRIGDVIEVAGWDTKEWEKNPIVLWGHQHRQPPVGKGVAVARDIQKKALVFDIEFVPRSTYEFGGLVGDMVEQGFVRATSVGFNSKKEEPRKNEDPHNLWPSTLYKEQELLELSMVNVPMHPGALAVVNSAERGLLLQKGFTFWRDGEKEEKPPMTMQTLIFSKEKFKTADEATAWAKAHDFHHDKVDETENSFRCRQRDPGDFAEESMRTVSIAEGVQAVMGHLKMDYPPRTEHITVFTMPAELREVIASLAEAVREQKTAIKELSRLVEVAPLDRDPEPEPDAAKASDGLAERYLAEVAKSFEDTRALFKP